MLLLNHGANPHQTIEVKDKKGNPIEQTIIEHLMKFGCECPRAILDASIQKLPDDTLIMDFEIFKSKNSLKANNTLKLKDYEMSLFLQAIDNVYNSLLLHPLMEIFLNLKWRAIGMSFLIKMLFQIILVATMTCNGIIFVNMQHCEIVCNSSEEAFLREQFDGILCNSTYETFYSKSFDMIGVQKRSDITDHKVSTINEKNVNVRCINRQLKPQNITGYYQVRNESLPLEPICQAFGYELGSCWTHNWSLIFMVFLLTLFFLREVREIYERGPKEYVSWLDNWIQESILVLSVSYLFFSIYDINLAVHAVAWMVFLVWIDLTLLLSKMDKIGEYVYMSKNVTKTMLFCMMIYIPSFFAFAFGFYLLLRPNENFYSYTATFFKVLSMMVGELEYDDTFSYDAVEKTGSGQFSTQIMFTFFLITVVLIIMNLLLAVTVSKTEDLEKESKLMQTESRVEDVVQSSYESKLDNIFLDCLDYAYKCKYKRIKRLPLLERCQKDGDNKYTVNDFS